MTQDANELEYEYAFAQFDREINLFDKYQNVAGLNPLHIAIQYWHSDILRFTTERMNLDKRIALVVFVRLPHMDQQQE